ncbi:MAG: hypothetical protein KAV87_51515 [Desulfobacteraceae bacterium]|nr:hypothetical protein [Desulfobacteraceae bacterium]
MPEPVTLSAAAIGGATLTEGIKFLYGQAGEVLKRWRERKSKASQEVNQPEAINPILPKTVFEGNLTNVTIDFQMVQQSEERLRQLRRSLTDYVDEIDEVNESDTDLLKKVDALRCLLEVIYRQYITFKGENRLESGAPIVVGRVDAKAIAGHATGLDAEAVTEGNVRGEVKADRVEEGGKATGVKVGTIGIKSS